MIGARIKCGSFTFIGHKTFARVYNMIHNDLYRRPRITIYVPSIFLKALKLSWCGFIFNTMLGLKNTYHKDFLLAKRCAVLLNYFRGWGWGVTSHSSHPPPLNPPLTWQFHNKKDITRAGSFALFWLMRCKCLKTEFVENQLTNKGNNINLKSNTKQSV